MALILAAAGTILLLTAALIWRAKPYQDHVRAAKGGVKIWLLPGGFKLWIRNTRVRGVVSYDPRPRLWLPGRRVAILLPGDRIRISKVIKARQRG